MSKIKAKQRIAADIQNKKELLQASAGVMSVNIHVGHISFTDLSTRISFLSLSHFLSSCLLSQLFDSILKHFPVGGNHII